MTITMRVNVVQSPLVRVPRDTDTTLAYTLWLYITKYVDAARLRVSENIYNTQLEIDISDCQVNQTCEKTAQLALDVSGKPVRNIEAPIETVQGQNIEKSVGFGKYIEVVDGTVTVTKSGVTFNHGVGVYRVNEATTITVNGTARIYSVDSDPVSYVTGSVTFEALDANGNVVDSARAPLTLPVNRVKLSPLTVDISGGIG